MESIIFKIIAGLHSAFGLFFFGAIFSEPVQKLVAQNYSQKRIAFKMCFSVLCATSLIFVYPLATINNGSAAFVSQANNAAIYLALASIPLYIFSALSDEIYVYGLLKTIKSINNTFYFTLIIRVVMVWGLIHFANF